MDALKIRYGDLERVYGRIARMDRDVFCAADLDMFGEPTVMPGEEFYLAACADPGTWPPLRSAIRGRYDISWTIARIMRIFLIEADAKYDFVLDQGFVAVPEGLGIGYPFRCRDLAGRSYLQFSLDEPDDAACRAIAGAFWRLLLAAPDDLQDFERRVNGPVDEWALADPVDLDYGCKFGHLYREIASE